MNERVVALKRIAPPMNPEGAFAILEQLRNENPGAFEKLIMWLSPDRRPFSGSISITLNGGSFQYVRVELTDK